MPRHLTPKTCIQPSDPNIRHVPLTKGLVAIVDAEDFALAMRYKCWAKLSTTGKGYYAYTWIPEDERQGNKSNSAPLHRVLLHAPRGMDVDHINHNTLDCRRANLRLCTRSQNCMNRHTNRNAKSGYKGIYKTRYNTYVVRIKHNGNCIHVGSFSSLELTKAAYASHAKEFFGEYACTAQA